MSVVKLVTKEQIVGLQKKARKNDLQVIMGVEENKEKRPSSYHGRENAETKKYRFTGNCHYCHKKGHQEAECHMKQHDNANNIEEEHALMMT